MVVSSSKIPQGRCELGVQGHSPPPPGIRGSLHPGKVTSVAHKSFSKDSHRC